MKIISGWIIGLVFGVCASAEPLLEGRVRLEFGEPVADAQVRLFDLTDLQRGAIARAQTDGTGYFALPLAALRGRALPEGFALGPNYPNPFNPSTIIPYQLAASSQVRLEVFNLLGQHIATLVDGERPAGFHTATWHATDAAGRAVGAGVYIYRMTVGVKHQTGRMVLLDGQAGVSAGGVASVMPGASGVGGSHGESEEYGLIVSGSGLVPYVDSSFRVEAGMAPVELVVSAGLHSAGKVTDDDCPLCDFFDAINDMAEEESEEEEEDAPEEEEGEEEDDTPEEERADGQEVIPDANLRAAIAAALGKARGATITKGDMTTLLRLEAKYADISDLTGLEFATNLEYLDLTGNAITDISPLAGLINLTELDIQNNLITDISALAGLTNLKRLFLFHNPLNFSSINDYIPALRDRGIWVGFHLTGTITDDPTPVTIPDAKLREEIAAKLGKASGETITRSEMAVLSLVSAGAGDVSDLTGLEFATNLTGLLLSDNTILDVSPLQNLTNLEWLWLSDNTISDVSPLQNLTNLTELYLSDNTISDVSPLQNLTNLTELWLSGNTISDVSPLQNLTNLTELYLSGNTISDVSPLQNLTNLTELYLSGNTISDVSPLRNLTKLTFLNLRGNLLNFSSVNDHILGLKRGGVTVYSDPFFLDSPFDIELVFLDDFTAIQKRAIEYSARHWMSIIRKDLPDYTFTQGWSGRCGDHSYEIPSGERIDDLRIYVTSFDDDDTGITGIAFLNVVRETSHLPVVGCINFNLAMSSFTSTALHEIGHVLGVGPIWADLGFLQNPSNAAPYFNGPLAIAAFNDAGGRNYAGAKVPVTFWGGAHWDGVILGGELMAVGGSQHLSAITIQSLADLGYSVDVTQAHPYSLNSAIIKASAKIAAPPTHAEPEWSCGTGQHQEPIYVVDPQGRIVRTISP